MFGHDIFHFKVNGISGVLDEGDIAVDLLSTFNRSSTTFYGWTTSGEDIMSIEIQSFSPSRVGGANRYESIDNVLYIAAPATVPEPAVVWLFCSGLIGLVSVTRKRKIA